MYSVGQEQDDESVIDAAGKAAYEQAAKSDMPPTRSDSEAIGGAAGTAACHAAAGATYGATELAAQLGWCSELGEAIGGAVYDFITGLWGEEYVAPQYDYVIARALRKATNDLARLYGGSWIDEARELERWNVPGATLITLNDGRGAYGNQRGPWLPYYSEAGINNYFRLLSNGVSARTAEIKTRQKLRARMLRAPSRRAESGPGLGTVAIAAAGIGGAIWLVSLL